LRSNSLTLLAPGSCGTAHRWRGQRPGAPHHAGAVRYAKKCVHFARPLGPASLAHVSPSLGSTVAPTSGQTSSLKVAGRYLAPNPSTWRWAGVGARYLSTSLQLVPPAPAASIAAKLDLLF
jgi:hypothetical protein